MPTGYTAKICEGEQAFSEFAVQCARAFGACVEQRDDPMDELPKTKKKSTYHERELVAAKMKLAQLKKMSVTKRTEFGKKKRADQIKYYEKLIVEKRQVRARLEKMLAQVNAWVPPDDRYSEFKAFMVQQLTSTIEHDGDVTYYEEHLNKEIAKSPKDYYDDEVKGAEWSVQYHRKEDKQDEDRTKERNKWITDLFQSVNEVDGKLAWVLLSKGDQ